MADSSLLTNSSSARRLVLGLALLAALASPATGVAQMSNEAAKRAMFSRKTLPRKPLQTDQVNTLVARANSIADPSRDFLNLPYLRAALETRGVTFSEVEAALFTEMEMCERVWRNSKDGYLNGWVGDDGIPKSASRAGRPEIRASAGGAVEYSGGKPTYDGSSYPGKEMLPTGGIWRRLNDEIKPMLISMASGGSAPASPTQPTGPRQLSPQEVAMFQNQLNSTEWEYRNQEDIVTVAGNTMLKNGAWQALRFRNGGTCSAWHDSRIVWEGTWEVLGDKTVRINTDNVGLVLLFEAQLTQFKVVNRSASAGRKKGFVPLDPFVGRWKWGRGGVVRAREDGYIRGEDFYDKPGQWKPARGKGKYEVIWNGGVAIDRVRLMSGNNRLDIENNKGHEFSAERVSSTMP